MRGIANVKEEGSYIHIDWKKADIEVEGGEGGIYSGLRIFRVLGILGFCEERPRFLVLQMEIERSRPLLGWA